MKCGPNPGRYATHTLDHTVVLHTHYTDQQLEVQTINKDNENSY